MTKRDVSETIVHDLVETGELRQASGSDYWILKWYSDRPDNLVCAAVILAQAVIVKTIMVNWHLEEE